MIAAESYVADFTALVGHIDTCAAALDRDGLVEMDPFDDGVMVESQEGDEALKEEKKDRERPIAQYAFGSIPRTEADADAPDLPWDRLLGVRGFK